MDPKQTKNNLIYSTVLLLINKRNEWWENPIGRAFCHQVSPFYVTRRIACPRFFSPRLDYNIQQVSSLDNKQYFHFNYKAILCPFILY